MSLIGSLVIGASLRTEKLERNAKSARGSLGKLSGAASGLKGAIVGLGAALGAGMLVNGLKNIVQAELGAIDKTSKFADEMGLTIAQLKGLELQTGLSGSKIENLEKGLQRLVRRLGEAKTGYGQGVKGLEALGIKAEEITQIGTYDALKKISEGIKGLKTPAERAAAAYSLFGKQGLELLTFLNSGADAMDKAKAEAEALGTSFSRLDGSQVEKANDALLKMSQIWKGIKQELTIAVAPLITAIADDLTRMGKEGVSSGNRVSSGLETMARAAGFFGDMLVGLKLIWISLSEVGASALGWFIKGWGHVINILKPVAKALYGVEIAFDETMISMGDSMLQFVEDQKKNFSDLVDSELPSSKVEKFYDRLKEKAKETSSVVKQRSSEIAGAMNEGMFAATEGANKLIDKLKEQITTFGMSANQAEIFKLQQQGAAQALIDQATALDKQIEGLERAKKAQEELAAAQQKMKDEAKAVWESTRTPLEKYRMEFYRLQNLMKKGLISEDTFYRAIAQAKQGLKDSIDLPEMKDDSKPAGLTGALDFRSAEARSVVLNSRLTGQNPAIKTQKDQLKESKKSNEHLAKIANQPPIIYTFG